MLTKLVFLIEQISNGLYFGCAFLFLLAFRSLYISRRELWAAEFELEREQAQRRQANAITSIFAVIELGLAIYAVAAVIAPTIRSDVVNTNPAVVANTTVDLSMITSTPGGDGQLINASGTPLGSDSIQSMMLTVTAAFIAGDSSGPAFSLTATPLPTLVGTIIAGMPPPVGCDKPDAQLEIPANGQVLFDSVTVVGTANTNNFASYKFELNGPSTGDSWTPVGGDKTSPVPNNGVLGQLALSPFQPGEYEFRLTVFDITHALQASCTVTVTIRERPPTNTPPGGGTTK